MKKTITSFLLLRLLAVKLRTYGTLARFFNYSYQHFVPNGTIGCISTTNSHTFLNLIKMNLHHYFPSAHSFSRQRANKSIFTAVFLLSFFPVFSQTTLWSPAPQAKSIAKSEQVPDLPDLEKGAVLQLDLPGMQALGNTAKQEGGGTTGSTTMVLLPMPDGTFQRFQIWESSLMEPGLAAKFPEIKSYIIKGVDDPHANGRMMASPYEFGAFFASLPNNREVFIRKISKTDATKYISFWGKDDVFRGQPIECLWEGSDSQPSAEDLQKMMMPGANETGDVLKVFRLSMTVTGKLSEILGWTTKAQALAALVTFLGQINVIYERDVSVRFVLPEAQDNVIFLNDATDPFTVYGGGESGTENIMVTDELIGVGGYDVGLILVTGGCCAAPQPSICGSIKAANFSYFNNLWVTAHEIGHQFSCHHTWTRCGPGSTGGLYASEYGSGTSIMSYSGLCNVDNILPPGEITFFGVYSQIEMTSHINTQTCHKTLNTGNSVPTSTIPASGFHIPVSTPFELVGTGSDADGDNLTYSWEQANIRNIDFTATVSIETPPTPADGNVPIARIFNPSASPRRTIPQLSDLLANNSTVYERLPTYTRNIKYRMYVRDNHPGAGGTTHQLLSFEVDGTAGPFLVSAPNTCVTWTAGSSQTVTWDVANTTNANVNCQNVKISLSTDGGYNYDYVLAASTANDGSESVTLPSGVCSNRSRIKVEAVGNIFFDISNFDFNIESGGTPITKANALQLDGSDDQAEITDNTLGNFGTGDFTIEMWVKTNDNSVAVLGKREACSCGNFWNFFIDGGRFRAEMSEAACANVINLFGTSTNLANGNWHHLAATRSGTTLKLYVDGNLEATGTSLHNFSNTTKLVLGDIVCGGWNFSGSLDEVRIWSVARSATEISDHKNCTLAGNESGLLAYYPMDSQDCGVCSAGTTTLEDKTANNYDGLFQNGAYTSLSSVNVTSCPTCPAGSITLTGNPSNQSVAIGASATFSVTATGNNLSYQWERSTDGGTTFSQIQGATASSYSFTAANGQNGWQFRCLLGNGCDTETSTAATLTLTCAAQTLSSITGTAAPCLNNYYTYFVSSNANITTWNWTAPSGWTVTNFGNMVFVRPSATAGNLSVTGTDACGNVTAAQTFAVAPVLVEITTQPASQSVNEGTAVNFTVAVSSGGGTTTYQWQQSTDFGASFSNIAGATSATFSIAAAAVGHDDWRYRCFVTNSCLIDTSSVATLTVTCTGTAPATPGNISGADLTCASAVLTYSVAEVGGASSYTWTLPAGWSGSSTTNSITVTATGTGGILKVKAVNACGMSGERSLAIPVNNAACQRAVHFDGVDDHLAVAQNNQALQGDLTISFWMKPDRVTSDNLFWYQTLVFNGEEFIVNLKGNQIQYIHSDNCCGYDNYVNRNFNTNTDISVGVWSHIAITRDVTNRAISLYLNGNFVETLTYESNHAQPGDNISNSMNFGAGANGEWLHFKGVLDEIKIWSALRTATEIEEDMFCAPTGSETNLKAYYSFEQGQPNGNNVAVTEFANAASAYAGAVVNDMAMTGTSSNVTDGSKGTAINGSAFVCNGGGGVTYTVDLPGTPTVTWTLPPGWTGSSTTESITMTPGATDGIIAAEATLSCGTVRLEKAVSTTQSLTNTALVGGDALDFDGTDDYVDVADGTYFSGDFTIEAWVYPKAHASWSRLIDFGNGAASNNIYLALSTGTSGTPQLAVFNGSAGSTLTAPTALPLNQWTHLAATLSGTTAKIFYNGVEIASATFANLPNNLSRTNCYVGRSNWGDAYANAKIDELRIWNVARTASQLQANLYCPVECAGSSLVLYLPFEDGIAGGGNTGLVNTQDFSNFGNNGTLSGFAQSGAGSNFVSGISLPSMTGGAVVCPSLSWTYSVPAISGATGHLWTLPSGWTGTSTTNSITVTPNGTGGTVQCAVAAACGNLTFAKSITANANCETALDFDGSNDMVTFTNNTVGNFGTGNFTIEYWVKTTDALGAAIAKRNSCDCDNWSALIDNGKARLELQVDGCAPSSFNLNSAKSVNDGLWHHVAFTRSGTTVSVYVDGVLDGTGTSSHDLTNTNSLRIGQIPCGAVWNLDGALDEIRLWNVARSASEINASRFCTFQNPPASMVFYAPFEDGVPNGSNGGSTATSDFSANQLSGALNSFALTGNSSNFTTGVDITRYADSDGDGFGNAAASTTSFCPSGTYVFTAGDCNDSNNAVKPDAIEACGNATDDNCNGVTDEKTLSLGFDNAGDFVNLGTALGNFGTGNFTIELRINTTDNTGSLLAKRNACAHDNFWDVLIDGGKIKFEIDENSAGLNYASIPTTPTVTDGNWHHVAVTRNGTAISVYIDGTLSATGTSAANINNAYQLQLGKMVCGGVWDYGGQMDELRIWNIARSATEINTFKNASLPATVAGLLAYYDFDNQNATPAGNNAGQTTLDDRTTNNYDGTLNGFALTGSTSNWLANPSQTLATFYADADGDGFGNSAVSQMACAAPGGYVANSTDCNDNNNAIHPNATETCNLLDDDCDGSTDEGVQSLFYADADGDGFGNSAVSQMACAAPGGYVANSTDCNDNNNAIHPNATETCNLLDDDCDGSTDEGVQSLFYADADGDGFGNSAVSQMACAAPGGYVANSTDCNDNNNAIHPGAPELCNGLDDDCSGSPEAATNSWTGAGDGLNWSNAPNWSDGIVPLPCQDVVVPAGTVTVQVGFNAVGKTLEVLLGAALTVEPTGTLEVQD